MTIGERIKAIRKSAKMNLDDFGAKIGVTGPLISLLENGRASVTDRTILSICREFHINEAWLRTGEGEMSAKNYADELERMCAERGLSHADYVAIRNIMDMPKAARDAVTAFMVRFAADIAAEQDAAAPKNVHDWTPDELIEEATRQVRAEEADRKKGTGEPSTGSRNVSGADCA